VKLFIRVGCDYCDRRVETELNGIEHEEDALYPHKLEITVPSGWVRVSGYGYGTTLKCPVCQEQREKRHKEKP